MTDALSGFRTRGTRTEILACSSRVQVGAGSKASQTVSDSDAHLFIDKPIRACALVGAWLL